MPGEGEERAGMQQTPRRVCSAAVADFVPSLQADKRILPGGSSIGVRKFCPNCQRWVYGKDVTNCPVCLSSLLDSDAPPREDSSDN